MGIILELDDRDTGRVLSGLRERRRKIEKTISKFGTDFDPEKGASMLEGLAAHVSLIEEIEEARADANSE